MADEASTTKRSTSPVITPIRRAQTIDEAAQRRPRSSNRFPTATPASAAETPSPSASRRRSSNFSEYSLNEARRSFQDDLLLPKPSSAGLDQRHESSAWHSAPLAFALLPAIGGMLFKNGSSIITDVMLLGLAALFLNWSVRLPWDWYQSAQEIRAKEEYNGDLIVEEESEDDVLSYSQSTMGDVPEEQGENPATPTPKPIRRLPAHETASNELYIHEVLALLSCFLFPLFGAYLLHTIRSQLSRPSEGLVSNYNLTIFLLASELRPMAHLVKLIQSRTLHLQRIVNANPYDNVNGKGTNDLKDIMCRLQSLEGRGSVAEATSGNSSSEPTLNGKQSAVLTSELRRSMQPDLDALNRAVRRYEKRATLQAFQTESRLLDLEARLNDAISLAAAAVSNRETQRGFTGILVDWMATAFVLPLQALATLAGLPFKTIITLINLGKSSVVGRRSPDKARKGVVANGSGNGKYPVHGRLGERLQSRASKR